jgi:zinc transporter ZupT
MPSYTVLAWIAVLALATLHILAGNIKQLRKKPRSQWLSIGGGISVAYAILHLLPELEEHQKVLEEAVEPQFTFLESHAHLIALFGLGTFYGIERAAKQSRRKGEGLADEPPPSVFSLSIGAFAIYNALIGYLIMREPMRDTTTLMFFTLAMALHFLANDFALELHHRRSYTHIGRWILTAALVVGAVLGTAFALPEPLIAAMIAFLTGGIILNVLKEELPEDRESRFSAFALGALSYAVLLISFT